MEVWKDVVGYEGLYQVSNLGNVRKMRFINNVVDKEKVFLISPQKMNAGYLKVVLYKGGKYRNKLVHRLVAETFIPNENNYGQVNHINGVKTDNKVVNLEWCNRSQNMQHAFRTGLVKAAATGKFGSDNPKAIKVNMIDKTTDEIIKKFDSIIDAARYLWLNNSGQICRCCKGELKTTHGYKWEYADIGKENGGQSNG